jgi:hypothetical protein
MVNVGVVLSGKFSPHWLVLMKNSNVDPSTLAEANGLINNGKVY